MAKEFRLQDPGEGIHEAEVVEVQVSAGDQVEDGDIVLVVETDKAAVEVPAPFTGTVEEVRVEEDQVVEVGDVLMTYSEDGGEGTTEAGEEEAESGEEEERTAKEVEGEEPAEETEKSAGESEEADEGAEKETGGSGRASGRGETPVPASPSTRRLARELEVDLREVSGSGPEGRVTAEDVRSYAEGEGGGKAAGTAAADQEGEGTEGEGRPAAEEGGAPGEEGSRSEDRETESGPAAGPFRTLVRKQPPLPDFSTWGPIHREPLRRIRRSVAKRMTLAWWEIPHVTHHEVADFTDLERFRREHEDAVSREGGQLTLTVLILKAAVAALREHPRFNASLDVVAEEIVFKDYCNVGLAVDTDNGLVVPVIRDADRKSLTELAREIPEMVERVRSGDVKQEDVQGGTFTLTNPGPLGGTSFSPIVRHPEVAILGTAAARLEPVVKGDLDEYQIVPRLRLPLVLAFDHRVNDGADAARFMNTVVDTLSDTDSLLLHM